MQCQRQECSCKDDRSQGWRQGTLKTPWKHDGSYLTIQFTFEWHHNDRSSGDDIIDLSHKGPVLVYIAPTATGTAGSGWVKIAQDGYDGKWAVERLVSNRGKHSVTIPNIAAGEYLLRAEIIALHEGNRVGGAQFYMECVQIKVTSSGTTTLPAGVAIPGAYSANDPGVLFDLYNGFTSYTIPGPAVWNGASSGGSGSSPAPSASATRPATTTLRTVTTSRPAAATTTAPSSGSGAAAAQWAQCGGINWTGPTTCQGSLVCKQQNPYYSQCLTA